MRNNLAILATLIAAPAWSGDIAFVTNQNSSDLSIIDVETRTEIRRVSIEGNPAGIAVVPELDAVFTVSPDTKTVRKLNRDGDILDSLILDGGPIGIAADPTRKRIFVSDWYNARVWIIDSQSLDLIDILKTGSAPAGLAISDDGKWLATADRDADQVTIFALTGFDKAKVATTGERPFGISFGPDGLLYAANVGSDSVTVVDPDTGTIVATIPVGARPYGVAFARGRGFVTNQYADTVTVFDQSDHSVIDTIDVGEYPEGIDVSKDGQHIFVANWFSNNLMMIDAEKLDILAEIDTGDGPRAFGQFIWETDE